MKKTLRTTDPDSWA